MRLKLLGKVVYGNRYIRDAGAREGRDIIVDYGF